MSICTHARTHARTLGISSSTRTRTQVARAHNPSHPVPSPSRAARLESRLAYFSETRTKQSIQFLNAAPGKSSSGAALNFSCAGRRRRWAGAAAARSGGSSRAAPGVARRPAPRLRPVARKAGVIRPPRSSGASGDGPSCCINHGATKLRPRHCLAASTLPWGRAEEGRCMQQCARICTFFFTRIDAHLDGTVQARTLLHSVVYTHSSHASSPLGARVVCDARACTPCAN